MNWFHLSVVVLLLLGASGRDYAPSRKGKRIECPTPRVIQDFDLLRYTGKWFQYQNFETPFELGLVCNMNEFTKITDAELKVVNSGLRVIDNDGVETRETTMFMEQVTVFEPVAPGEPQPGKLFVNLTVPGRPPRTMSTPNYCVVDTDYETYSVVYSCRKTDETIAEIGSIITRVRGKKPENLEEIVSNLRRNGIDTSQFEVTDQTNCD